MRFAVPKSEYIDQFRTALKQFPGYTSAFIHSDLLPIGAVEKGGGRDEICQGHVDALQEVFEGRPLVFPAYNYDFYRTRVYDVANDPCKVGALGEYVRRAWPERRSLTPVFSHVVLNDHDYDLGFVSNPFAPEGLFWQGMAKGALICCLGAPFSNSTFQHVAEENMHVPYRYRKSFAGQVKTVSGEMLDVMFEPPVFPLNPEARCLIEYRWDHLQNMLERDGSLVRLPLGRGHLIVYSPAACFERYTWLLKKNIFYALTVESQEAVLWYMDKIGGPMTVENMEPGWTPQRRM